MQVVYGNSPSASEPRRVAALGVFDGVHLGHQKVIKQLLRWARELGALAEVITFDRHPRTVIEGGYAACVNSLRHKLLLLERYGVERCRVLTFDSDLAGLEAETFARRVLRGAVGVVTGYDQRFGRDRRGDVGVLREVGAETGYDVRLVAPVEVGGRPVSSTLARRSVEEGRLDEVAGMLGRPPSLLGTVVRGVGVGRRLGFPTANLDVGGELLPPEGVYHTETVVPGAGRLVSATNLGKRPVFGRPPAWRGPSVVEVHLLDFEGDLYGKELEVFFLERIRDEVGCESERELARLIEADVKRVRERADTGGSAGRSQSREPSV